ncbi:uncharacterized protein F5147DRAFT_657594 [Suillus discolor]|uniref:Uncharacterized protein n=1 Tax=Suillus discolor TaxID=1912936 RepID=A0A9P7JNL2_9AGAM|nr:uncharacterized protein F5147DRAFT_657594 [Suillus discolor]KAG2092816.1 hypothetical protein F5147DRAFT_657594 [Suillus discolor]
MTQCVLSQDKNNARLVTVVLWRSRENDHSNRTSVVRTTALPTGLGPVKFTVYDRQNAQRRSLSEKVGKKSLLWRSSLSVMIATTGGGKIDLDDWQCSLFDLTGFVSKDSPHPIAQGSFGDVWKCTYTASNRQGLEIAVKSIRVDVAGDDF